MAFVTILSYHQPAPLQLNRLAVGDLAFSSYNVLVVEYESAGVLHGLDVAPRWKPV
jgi:hypothetical protein